MDATNPDAITHRFSFDDAGAHAEVAGIAVDVRGNTVTLTWRDSLTGEWIKTREVRTYGDPIYGDLEGMLRRAGEGARIAMQVRKQSGAVLYFYDGRPYRAIDPAEFGLTAEDADGFYDGGNFGFIMSLLEAMFDEWGTAPFPENDETMEQYHDRVRQAQEMWFSALGGKENVTVIDMTEGDDVLGVSYDDERG